MYDLRLISINSVKERKLQNTSKHFNNLTSVTKSITLLGYV